MPEKAIFKIALDKAMTQCSYREFCCDDIHNKLSLWGVDNSDSEKIIAILVRDNFKYNKWGKVKIAAHLRAKKLPTDIIKSALDSIDNELYSKLLRGLIEGHRKSFKAKNQYDLKAKLLRYGLSKGFESNLLYDLLNEIE